MSRASRLVMGRALRWLAVAIAATALLVLLVDWVEHGSRVAGSTGGAALMASLQLALLRLPAHLSRAAPVAVAIGASLAVVGLRRSGEWQALGAAGLGPLRLFAPIALLGGAVGLGAAALDAWVVPSAERAYHRALAHHSDRPLRQDGGTWLSVGGLAFHLEGDPSSGAVPAAHAFAVGDPGQSWTRAALLWRDDAWRCEGDCAPGAPWDRLPAPDHLGELIGPEPPSALSWGTLSQDHRPSSRAELQARISRPLASPLAAIVAAAIAALLAPGPLVVLLAAAPVLAWELLASAAQAQAAIGQLPGAGIPIGRLVPALLIAGLLLWRLRRP